MAEAAAAVVAAETAAVIAAVVIEASELGDVLFTARLPHTQGVELPTESLDFGEIRGALEGLLAQAVDHRATLRSAAEGGDELDDDDD